MKELIGKTITKYVLSKDKQSVDIRCDDGMTARFDAEGD